jgi:hypothetical protein
MADFNESMKTFTDRLQASIDDRTESLGSIHQATTDLLDSARSFMEDVALGHELRTDEIQAFMARSRADRCETVQAMREMHRGDLAAMSDEMRRMLDETTTARVEFVNAFMTTSRADRLETARAMRDNHRDQLAAMSEELRATLDEANTMRRETVGAMRKSFQVAQRALANDLKGAAMTWREFAASR